MKKRNSEIVRDLRARSAPQIDGSYIVLSRDPLIDHAEVSHLALTPLQIAAEARAKGMGIAPFVYFIRDHSLPAPYWISPARKRDVRMEATIQGDGVPATLRAVYIRHLVYDVARSREDRRDAIEVLIPLGAVEAKNRERRNGGRVHPRVHS